MLRPRSSSERIRRSVSHLLMIHRRKHLLMYLAIRLSSKHFWYGLEWSEQAYSVNFKVRECNAENASLNSSNPLNDKSSVISVRAIQHKEMSKPSQIIRALCRSMSPRVTSTWMILIGIEAWMSEYPAYGGYLSKGYPRPMYDPLRNYLVILLIFRCIIEQ